MRVHRFVVTPHPDVMVTVGSLIANPVDIRGDIHFLILRRAFTPAGWLQGAYFQRPEVLFGCDQPTRTVDFPSDSLLQFFHTVLTLKWSVSSSIECRGQCRLVVIPRRRTEPFVDDASLAVTE